MIAIPGVGQHLEEFRRAGAPQLVERHDTRQLVGRNTEHWACRPRGKLHFDTCLPAIMTHAQRPAEAGDEGVEMQTWRVGCRTDREALGEAEHQSQPRLRRLQAKDRGTNLLKTAVTER